MEPFEFVYPAVDRVVFGRESVAERLGDLLGEFGMRRSLLVTGRTLATKTDLVEQVMRAVGDRAEVSVFDGAREHAPSACVFEAVKAAREFGADGLIAFGGSSALDTAKGVALVLAEGARLEEMFIGIESGLVEQPQLAAPKLPIVSIPTTLSGSEWTAVLGISNEQRRVKHIFRNRTLTPRAVFLDANYTVATPEKLWVSTALKLFDHAVERILSKNHKPLIDAQGIAGMRLIRETLEESTPLDGGDVAARREPLLQALWIIQNAHGNVGAGLSHALAHQFGARNSVPHGYGSALFLPPTLVFNREAAADRYRLLAEGLGLSSNGDVQGKVIAEVDAFVERLELPRRLRDVNVAKEDLRPAAEATIADPTIKSNPRQPETTEELVEFLEAIW